MNSALEGMGIALGRDFLIRDLVSAGRQRILIKRYLEVGYGNVLVSNWQCPNSYAAKLFRDWLITDVEISPLTEIEIGK